MVISKRAQIFLLAAVIVSAIVISLGITANQAIVNSEPKNFNDFSYEVTREVGAVIDYEIYTNFSEDDNLEEFVDTLSENIQDNNPDANFILLYGNEDDMTLKTYNPNKPGKLSKISIGSFEVEMKGVGEIGTSKIKIQNDKNSKGTLGKGSKTEEDSENLPGEITVNLNDNQYSFPISKHHQVIFLMQKDVEDDSFITGE